MQSWRDRFNQVSGKKRIVVCRVFLHLAGKQVAPLLGVLNRAAYQAVDAKGEMQVLGEGLVDLCQGLVQYETYWKSSANEGDLFWSEGEAAQYLDELFIDSAQRYQGEPMLDEVDVSPGDALSLPITQNLVVMMAIAYEGESPELETELDDVSALKDALKAMSNLQYQGRLRAVQIHFSPAHLGDELDDDQLLLNFPELVPL